MATETLSGKRLSSLLAESKRQGGTWSGLATEAKEKYGERGGAIAVLLRPTALQGTRRGCEGILNEAGFSTDRALQLTNEPYTIMGLRKTITRIRTLIEEDVCLTFLQTGSCSGEKLCEFKHEIPH